MKRINLPDGTIIIDNTNNNPNLNQSIIRITFKNENQLPDIMILQEFYDSNQNIVHADCLYSSIINLDDIENQQKPIIIIENPNQGE